jgi:hypothetical protein
MLSRGKFVKKGVQKSSVLWTTFLGEEVIGGKNDEEERAN